MSRRFGELSQDCVSSLLESDGSLGKMRISSNSREISTLVSLLQ